MKGVYQHCGEKHFHRYLAEFDFRYRNRVRLGVDDTARADRALVETSLKRLAYRKLIRIKSRRGVQITVRLMAKNDRIELIMEDLSRETRGECA